MKVTPIKDQDISDRRENPKLTYEVKTIPNRQQKFRELILFISKESKEDINYGSTKSIYNQFRKAL